jgi:hypothetical protein
MHNLKNLKDQRFNRLTVIERAGASRYRNATWRCRCDCGNEIVADGNNLLRGNTRSCGCLKIEQFKKRVTTHGHAPRNIDRSGAYRSWKAMHRRCSPNAVLSDRKLYFDNGVTVCARWSGKAGFANFLEDMGERPPGKSLDRYPNGKRDPQGLIDHGYRPGNCRWATALEQARNK